MQPLRWERRPDGEEARQEIENSGIPPVLKKKMLDGEVLIEHTRPAPGVRYVGNGRPRGQRPKSDEMSPKS